MGVRPTLGDIEIVTLVGGWAAADRYTVGDENSLLIRCRQARGIRVARSRSNPPNYFTIDSGQAQVIPCMNSNGEVLYFWGTAGDTVEIWRQNDV
jgi:hypothetical protein